MQRFRYFSGSRAEQLRNTVLTAKCGFYEDLFYIAHTYYPAQQRRSIKGSEFQCQEWECQSLGWRAGLEKSWLEASEERLHWVNTY